MNSKIKSGTIRCKFCNKIKLHATMPCDCQKKQEWNNPNRGRKTLRLIEKRSLTPTPSKEFRAMLKKKHLSHSKTPPVKDKGEKV